VKNENVKTEQEKPQEVEASAVNSMVMRNGSSITFTTSNSNKLIGSGLVCCPNCGTPWEDEMAVLTCPCLDA
jgi:rubrerythrin